MGITIKKLEVSVTVSGEPGKLKAQANPKAVEVPVPKEEPKTKDKKADKDGCLEEEVVQRLIENRLDELVEQIADLVERRQRRY